MHSIPRQKTTTATKWQHDNSEWVSHCNSTISDRPRDALCLSVVIASIVKYVECNLLLVTSASGLPLCTIMFCSLFFQVINKIHWWVAVVVVNGRPRNCYKLLHTVDRWLHSTSRQSDSQILSYCVLSPRFLAEPKWQEERWIRIDTVSLQQFHQFNQLIRSYISTRRELSVRSYFQLQCHC